MPKPLHMLYKLIIQVYDIDISLFLVGYSIDKTYQY